MGERYSKAQDTQSKS